MKKELSPAVMIAVVAVALLLIGGLGYRYFVNATGGPGPSVDREMREAEAAGGRYEQFKQGPVSGPSGGGGADFGGGVTPGGTPPGPPTGGTFGEAAARGR
jgi:hypothetical protein